MEEGWRETRRKAANKSAQQVHIEPTKMITRNMFSPLNVPDMQLLRLEEIYTGEKGQCSYGENGSRAQTLYISQ